MFGPVDLARSEITDQQLIGAKDIQGQETIMVIVTMKEATFLVAMDGIVRGIEVQDQLFGWGLIRRDVN